MNVNAIVTILLIGGAVWFAYNIYKEHGVSWSTVLAPLIIWAVAFLLLWVGNTWAIKPMQTQAQGITGQTQNMLSDAFPEVIQPIDTNVESGPPQITFGNAGTTQQQAQGQQFAQGDGQATVLAEPAAPPEPPAPPENGATRWGGNTQPGYGNQYIPYQAQCFASAGTLQQMLLMGYVPSGVQVQILAENNVAMRRKAKEIWGVHITFPHSQVNAVYWQTEGVTKRAIEDAIGGEIVTGFANWPLIQEVYSEATTSWNVLEPVVCQH